MKTNKKKLFALLLIVTFVVSSVVQGNSLLTKVTSTLNEEISIKWNGERFIPKEDNGAVVHPLVYKGRTYLPVRFIAEKAGVDVGWDQLSKTVMLDQSSEIANEDTEYTKQIEELNNEIKDLKNKNKKLQKQVIEKESQELEERKDTEEGYIVSEIELEVLRLSNIERSKSGLSPLRLSDELSKVSRIKSQDMADKNYFSHTSPTYGSPFDMMKEFRVNYSTAGENIAKGHQSAETVMKGWMNSPGHKANILNARFGTLGVGYVNENGTTYWTQMFTN